jgi:hypothetical protein
MSSSDSDQEVKIVADVRLLAEEETTTNTQGMQGTLRPQMGAPAQGLNHWDGAPTGLVHGTRGPPVPNQLGAQREMQEAAAAEALMQIGSRMERPDRLRWPDPPSPPPRREQLVLLELHRVMSEFQRHHGEMLQEMHSQSQATRDTVHQAVFQAQKQTEERVFSEWKTQNEVQTGEQRSLREAFQESQQEFTSCMVAKHQELIGQMQQQHDLLVQQQSGLINNLGQANHQLRTTIEEGHQGLSQAIGQLSQAVLDLTRTCSQTQDHTLKSIHQFLKEFTHEHTSTLKQLQEGVDRKNNHPPDKFSLDTDTDGKLGLPRPNFSRNSDRSSHTRKATAHSGKKAKHGKRHQKDTTNWRSKEDSTDSSSGNDTDTSVTALNSDDESKVSGKSSRTHHKRSKLTPFNGKERWKVWYKRFKVCTKEWTSSERLEEMLPLLRGTAADFVFDQLPARTLESYPNLVKELENRFRKVENPRTYRTKLSKLKQKGETVEEFAAEIKKIYDKAYPDRNIKTREEDLLQKFLEGLKDQNAASQVQFIRKLQDIDEAVDAIVNFQELHGKSEKVSRSRKQNENSTEESDSEEEDKQEWKQGHKKNKKTKPVSKSTPKREQSAETSNNLQWAQKGTQTPPPPENSEAEGNTRRNFQGYRNGPMDQQMYGNFNQPGPRQPGPPNRQMFPGRTAPQNSSGPTREFICFKCGGPNHIAKNCPAYFMGSAPPFPGPSLPAAPYMTQNSGNMNMNPTQQHIPMTTASKLAYVYPPLNRVPAVSMPILTPIPVAPTQTTASHQSGNLLGPVL